MKNVLFLHSILESKELHDNLIKKNKDLNINYYSFNFFYHAKTLPKKNIELNQELLVSQLIKYIHQNKLKDLIIIADGFASSILVKAYNEIKIFINKVILINPLNNSIFSKSFFLKKDLFPANFFQMFNKQKRLFFKIQDFVENPNWVNHIKNDLKNIIENNMNYIYLMNDLLNYRNLFFYIKNITKMGNMEIILSEYDFINNNRKSQNFYKNFQINIIKNSGNNYLWEGKEEYIKILKKILK